MQYDRADISLIDYESLLDSALQRLSLPVDYGVVLEGSIAEGFGNRTSDVDFLVVTVEDLEAQNLPVVMFLGGCRVEVRVRSAADVVRLAEKLLAAPDGQAPTLKAEELDRLQRFLGSKVLRNAAFIASLKAQHDAARLATVASQWHRKRALGAANRAFLLEQLGLSSQSASWMRRALVATAKGWAAERGEVYIKDKWLDCQLERLNTPPSLRQELWELLGRNVAPNETASYLGHCLNTASSFGMTSTLARDLGGVSVAPRSDVTTWQVGTRLCAVRDKKELFIFGETAAKVWRTIVFGRPIDQFIAASGLTIEIAARCLARFHLRGLIAFAWSDDVWNRADAPIVTVPSGPCVSVDGVSGVEVASEDVVLLHLPVSRLCFAGCELIWANTSIENAWEDFVGAFEKQQWRVVQAALHNVVAWACQIVFSAHGVNPPPDLQEIASRLSEIADIDAEFAREAEALRFISIGSADEAEAGKLRVELFLEQMRNIAGGGFFPTSFETADGWRQTLEYIFDWARLAAFVDDLSGAEGRTFPIEEVRELMALRRDTASRGGTSLKGGEAIGRWLPNTN